MTVTVQLVQARLYAIHQTMTQTVCLAERYFTPPKTSTPIIFSLPENSQRNRQNYGQKVDSQIRSYRLFVIIGEWTGGQLNQTAQDMAETLLDTINDLYLARPRLELTPTAADQQPLNGCIEAWIDSDAGVVAWGDSGQYATLQFILNVHTRKTF